MLEHLDDIYIFVQVAEAGSFAAAAVRLNLSRSAVGKTIARLENRLGIRLFHRTTRKQALTEQGELFFSRCSTALAQLAEAEAEVEASLSEPFGNLSISAPTLFGRRCISPILLKMTELYPRLQIAISFTDRQTDLLQERIDIAIRIGSLKDTTSITARKLATHKMYIVGSPSYFTKHGRPTKIKDLHNHKILSYSSNQNLLELRNTDGSIEQIRTNTKVQLDDLEAIADAAISGYGLALLPNWMLSCLLSNKELEKILVEHPTETQPIHAIWPSGPFLPLKIRVTVDALLRELPSMMTI